MHIRIIAAIAFMMLCTAHVVVAQENPEAPSEETPPGKPQIAFEPANPLSGDRLALRVKPGERTFWATVHWKRNGASAGEDRIGEGDTQVPFKGKLFAGDEIEASVVPFSFFSVEGEPASIKVKVSKTPPDMKLVSQEISGQVYRAVVKVLDREGGPIALTLKEGPPGMTISQDGKITWRFDSQTAGRFSVVVSAKDKFGSEAVLSYSFGVRRPGR